MCACNTEDSGTFQNNFAIPINEEISAILEFYAIGLARLDRLPTVVDSHDFRSRKSLFDEVPASNHQPLANADIINWHMYCRYM